MLHQKLKNDHKVWSHVDERTPPRELSGQRYGDGVDNANRPAWLATADGQGIFSSMGGMRGLRGGCAGLFRIVQCFDCAVPRESRSSGKIDGGTSRRRSPHFALEPRGNKIRGTRQANRQNIFFKALAFLAPLVSASFLSFLLRRNGPPRALGESRLAGREAHGLRPLAYRRQSLAGAREIRASGTD